jgi:hypothetical protein
MRSINEMNSIFCQRTTQPSTANPGSVNEDFLRDTVNVPYYDRRSLAYPSVRLRMDFRDPNTVGTFIRHP